MADGRTDGQCQSKLKGGKGILESECVAYCQGKGRKRENLLTTRHGRLCRCTGAKCERRIAVRRHTSRARPSSTARPQQPAWIAMVRPPPCCWPSLLHHLPPKRRPTTKRRPSEFGGRRVARSWLSSWFFLSFLLSFFLSLLHFCPLAALPFSLTSLHFHWSRLASVCGSPAGHDGRQMSTHGNFFK